MRPYEGDAYVTLTRTLGGVAVDDGSAGRGGLTVPVQAVAPALQGFRLSAQWWRELTFLHWPVPPEHVEHLFPAGSRPDVLDGTTYVGLVPFVMRGAGPGPLPVPYFGDFCETNVRLYSLDDQDRHGIVFCTLDATRLATVLLARVGLGLPYAWSRMRTRRDGDIQRYAYRRRWPSDTAKPRTAISVRIGAPTGPTPTETWLTSRWGLHTTIAGRGAWIPNEHHPWPLREAELLRLDSDLVQSCGIEVGHAQMLRPLWTPGVRTTFGRPQLLH